MGLCAIGLLTLAPQPCLAQDPGSQGTGGVGWITQKDERIRERFRQLLLAAPTRDLVAGWQLAQDLGRPVAPLLWEQLAVEKSNVESRLIVLAAAVLAGGLGEDDALLQWLDQQKPMFEERALAALLLALGPDRLRPVANVTGRCLGPARSPEVLLQVAVRLASARFPGVEENGAPAVIDDAGSVAAAAFAGTPIPLALRRWFAANCSERHAELAWRGLLLGAARRARPGVAAPDGLLDLARPLAAHGTEARGSLHSAAVWCLARHGALRADGPRLDWQLLQVAAADPRAGEALAAWFGSKPLPRDERPERLAVSYALTRPLQTVLDERTLWGSEVSVRAHVALALAFRLLGGAATPPIDASMPGLAEWQFVRFAVGAPIERGSLPEDPHLRVALQLASDGRLPRAALRTALEEALWRWGSHPGLVAWRLERLLVRDLLLSGSNLGGGKFLPHIRPDLRYTPGGLDRKDAFFEVAVALFEFLSVPRAPVPAEHRLGG